MSHPRLLITGFEPFAHYAVNPSGEAALRLNQEFAPVVVGVPLPVDFTLARAELVRLLDLHRPDACLCMGLAAGDLFRLEQSARKVDQFRHLPGDPLYKGTWRWDSISAFFERSGAPWQMSQDCGRYVCESTYWSLLQHATENGRPRECGFLHVPAASEAWPTERTVSVIRELVEEWLESRGNA